jgi:hypothetical protein
MRDDYIDIVFDGSPSPESERFVEMEDAKDRSIRLGEWLKRSDGYRVLRLPDSRSATGKREGSTTS